MKDTAGAPADLLPNLKKNFNAKKLCMFFILFARLVFLNGTDIISFFDDVGRKAAFGIRAVNRMQTLAHVDHDSGAQMREDIFKYKEESAKVLFLCRRQTIFFTRLIVFFSPPPGNIGECTCDLSTKEN